MLGLTTVGAELANSCRDKSSTYIKNLIQGFCQIAGGNQGATGGNQGAAAAGRPLEPHGAPSITLNPSNK
jgi:hypothetical protein